MITVTRSLLCQVRSVLRRAGVGKSKSSHPEIIVRAANDGLRIQVLSDQLAIEYHHAGQFDAQELVVPCDLLVAAEGRSEDLVTLQSQGPGRATASWIDQGIPQELELVSNASADFAAGFPAMPEAFTDNSPELLAGLATAATIAEGERTRFALDCLQLRGTQGKIVTTDGRQVLVQSGFAFPWTHELLVPASRVFASKELAQAGSVRVGLIQDWVAFQSGPWTIWLRIEKEARFPKIDDLIRDSAAALSRLSIDQQDGQFLCAALARLPSDEPSHQPITLDLNGQVIVRAKAVGQTRPTELVLSRSQLDGDSLSINTDRRFLARAVKLGFEQVCFFGPQAPVLCDDGRRQYLWAVLDSDGALRPSADAIRIEATAFRPFESQIPHKTSRRRLNVIHTASQSNAGNQDGNNRTGNTQAGSGRPSNGRRSLPELTVEGEANRPIVQAMALRAVLRETLIQTNELIRALKRDKRQSRLVASTLASLKQLQKVAG